MTRKIITVLAVLLISATTQAQTLHVRCGFAGNLNCDGREIVVTLYNPSCGTAIGSTAALQIFTGDDYTVNLASIWGGTLPSPYEIYSIEVRALSSCALTPGPSGNPCGWDNGVTVGENTCTGYNASECYEITGNCGPSGGIACSAGQTTYVHYMRDPFTGNVELEID